jgi:hypothetical protein
MTHVVASPIVSPHQSSILDDDDDAYFLNTDSSNTAKTPANNKDAAATAAPADAAPRADATGKSPSYRKAGSIKLYASPSIKIDDDSPFHEQQLELQLDHDDDPNMQECEKVRCCWQMYHTGCRQRAGVRVRVRGSFYWRSSRGCAAASNCCLEAAMFGDCSSRMGRAGV